MRKRIVMAALLTTVIVTPALAQDQDWRRHRGEGGQQPAAQPDAAAPAREQWRWTKPGNDQAQRPAQAARSEPARDGQDRGQPQPAPQSVQQVPQQRGWRGHADGNQVRGNGGANVGWQQRDRDRDGIVNARDRDRDGDGIRNRRDWDRDNNGHVDRRWDQNRNGVVDRRFDNNRDGVRDWRRNDGRNWNNGWRNDRRYDWQGWRSSNHNLFRAPRYYSPYGYSYGYRRFGVGIYLDSILFDQRYWIDDPYRYRLPDADWPYHWVRYYNDVLLVDERSGYIVDVIHDFFY